MCLARLQRARHSPELLKITTTGGRITISLSEFLSFGDIIDEVCLIDWDLFIRKDLSVQGFRDLVDLTWDRNCRHANRKFTFVLTAAAACLKELQPIDRIQSTPAAKLPSAVTPEHEIEVDIILPAETPTFKRSRVSQKSTYSPATLAKYSKAIETKLMLLLKQEIPSANDELRTQVLKDVMTRLQNRFGDGKDVCNVNESIVSNIKALVTSMNKFGPNDRESIRFKENLTLAICNNISLTKFNDATSLSRRVLEHGREMRAAFDAETTKAVAEDERQQVVENDIDYDDNSEADTENDSDNDQDDNDETNENNEGDGTDIQRRKTRATNGEVQASKNRYRRYISSRSRKVRSDALTGVEIQRFCHESQWGGRIDTLKLSRQSVIVNQPGGGCEYEPVRSYQFTVNEMYTHFKDSEYGARQRNGNSGRNLSLRRFRELICPCMTDAKQRDTADQIVADSSIVYDHGI